ncbi:cellulose synthase [Pseudoxanthomonas broegbernensis]|uniref:Cellulose synthase n=1 Tax=Pseudoxanthomonas broegbernensis TaxID=83619 RepID=A0A7V8GMT9_9GAMM|nr:cellulose biosynthesis protein BcsD [Pseudoxanthomonas broegbernensis]KAF1686580.1 cellulose synthase [Pseudoxanthomonas broegbernensis]MBB6063672.1 hypothetical protein [Pseudoxanthomonas broegbernensis]
MNAPGPLDYYRSQACSLQWRGFVRALGEEFELALEEADRLRLMARIGTRFALAHPLPGVASLDALQGAANAAWAALDWGYATFEEQHDRVLIRHGASPLAAAMGGPSAFVAGFLEGVYRQWFRDAGMSPGLDVRAGAAESQDVATFLLSRAP